MQTNPRREFLRHTIDVPLEVERDGHEAALTEQGVNVSYGGLAFVSDHCPEVGELLRLRIRTVDPPFEGRARVVWCRREAGRFLVGVQFLDPKIAFQSRMVQQVCSIENYRKQVRQMEGRELSTQEAATEWISRFAGRFPDSETIYEDPRDPDHETSEGGTA